MSNISFANSPGNLFNCIGSCGALIKSLLAYQQTQQTNMIGSTGLSYQLAAQPDIQALVGSAWVGQMSSPEAIASLAQNVAQSILSRIVWQADPLYNQTFQSINTQQAIAQVILQMQAAGASVLQMTMGQTPSVSSVFQGGSFTGTGNGVVFASLRRPFDGLLLENAFAEILTFVCSSDSYTGGATPYNEPFNVTGQGAETDYFAYDWPQGSNCSLSINAVDGNTSNGSGNLLTNSGFTNFTITPNVPDNYTLIVGTAGVNTIQNTSIVYGSGGSSLQLTGDVAGTKTSLTQAFNSSGGTTSTLSPQEQVAFNVYMRRDGTAAGAGVLTIDLIDQNNNVILDNAGNANSLAINLTALTTAWTAFQVAFRTPTIMPAGYAIRYHLTTALTNGRSVYLDDSALTTMVQSYVSGPFVAVFAGGTPFVQGDYASDVISNSRGSGGTLSTFQTLWAQLFSQYMIPNEFLLPSSLTPTISDSLI